MKQMTQDYLKLLLSYDEKTGVFTWRVRPIATFADRRGSLTWNKRYAGNVAGSPDNKGYLRINFGGMKYKSHRLAWLYVYGEWPETIDHINGVKSDNRIENLRDVSFKENMRNRPMTSKNQTGANGVELRKGRKKYISSISINRKWIYLGSFDSLADAEIARVNANKLYGFHENHGRKPGEESSSHSKLA